MPTRLWLQQGGDQSIFPISARLMYKPCGTPPDAFLVFDALEAARAWPMGQALRIERQASLLATPRSKPSR